MEISPWNCHTDCQRQYSCTEEIKTWIGKLSVQESRLYLGIEECCTAIQDQTVRVSYIGYPAYIQSSSSSFLTCNSRLRSAIRRHHPPQRAVLSQICCFRERKMVMLQILLNGAEPCDAGMTQLSSPVCWSGGQQDPLSICVVVHAHNMPK